ncbi:endolytic transglycosylase MltG [candidate division KSB1 bacterium]
MWRKNWFKFIIGIIIILLLAGSIFGWHYYKIIFYPISKTDSPTSIYIPTGSEFDDVVKILWEDEIIIDTNTFIWLARKKNYPTLVKPGHYLIHPGMSNNIFINMLRAGKQTPVNVIFNTLYFKEEFASVISKQIEADSTSILELLNDAKYLKQYDTDPENVFCLLIPNTYEFYWNSSATQFMERMFRENNKFWNEKRKKNSTEINLSVQQVTTLASIVELESSKNEEKPIIAGVYINRIKKGMLLQADPTLKFAKGDFSIKRLLKKDKEIDSPYNTYKYAGLPPGPICLPSVTSIDAVLNYEDHNYLFFCADAENPGYHVFTKSYNQHLQNAKRYQRFLNREKIYR